MSLHHVNDNIELQRYQNRTISLLTLSDIDHHTYIHHLHTCIRESEKLKVWKYKKKKKGEQTNKKDTETKA